MSDSQITEVVHEPAAPIEGVQTQEPQIENQEVEAEKPKKSDDFLAPKFAALTRKEKQIRAYEAQIKAREAELQKRLAEIEEKSKSSQSEESALREKLKRSPLKTLAEEAGLTFDQLVEMQMNEQNPTPQMLIEQIKAELESKMEEKYGKITETLREKEEREAQERYEAAVNGYRAEINQFIEQNAETYELISANAATDLMFETAQAFYEQTGRVPSHEEVAQAVEAHLEEEIQKIVKLKKFQKLQTAQNPEAKPEAQKTAQTLSNTLAAEVPKSGDKVMSREQSLAEAAKLIRWTDD